MNLPEVRRKGGRGSLRGGNGGVAHVWAGQKLSRFFFQPLRPPFMGTTRALSFFKILYFSQSPTGSKTFAVSTQGDVLQATRGRRLEDFQPSLFVFHFANPEVLFSTCRISTLPVVEFFVNVRKNDFCAKPVVRIWCNPEGLFSIGQTSVLPVDFLVVLFKTSNRVAKFFERVRRNYF